MQYKLTITGRLPSRPIIGPSSVPGSIGFFSIPGRRPANASRSASQSRVSSDRSWEVVAIEYSLEITPDRRK